MAAVTFFDSFNYDWAQNVAVYEWDDNQWKAGWAAIGSTPPSVGQFDAHHKVLDQKINWIYRQLKEAADGRDIELSAGDDNALNEMFRRASGGYMFQPSMWMGPDNSIPEGYFAMSGQQITELQVPGLGAAVTASGQPTTSEANWQADPLQRGKFVVGAGWVRMPDWNGNTAGSIGSLYFSGAGNPQRRGTVVGDAIRNIVGSVGNVVFNTGLYATGALGGISTMVNSLALTSSGSSGARQVDIDASRVVPTAADNRPRTVYGTWVMRLFGGITNVGTYDAAALVAAVDAFNIRLTAMETREKPLGQDQTWQLVTGSRSYGVTYTNSTGRTIFISAYGGAATGGISGLTLDVGGVTADHAAAHPTTFVIGLCVSAAVPAGATYKVTASGTVTPNLWSELR